MNQKTIDNNKTKKIRKIKTKSIINQSTKLESNMLPPQFRRRSSIVQRSLLITIVILYSFALGTMAFVILGDVKEKFSIVTKAETTFLLIAIMILAFTLLLNVIFVNWSRTKTYVITWSDFVAYSISPLSTTCLIIFVQWFYAGSTPEKLISWMGYLPLFTSGATVIFVLLRNLIVSKKYHEAKYRTFFTSLGLVITASPIFLIVITGQANSFRTFDVTPLIEEASIFIGGIIIFLIGISLSSKYIISGEKNIWSSIRYMSGLPSISIFALLLAISIQNSLQPSFIPPTYMHAGICGFILLLWFLYLFFRARIANMSKTNPLYNEVFLKLFIASILIITLCMTFVLPAMTRQKEYGSHSYLLLTICAITILMGIIMAHFMNLITYTKHAAPSIMGVLASTFLIFALTLAIASLKSSQLISQILGRQLAITFLIIITIFQLVSLVYNMLYIFTNTAKKTKDLLVDEDNNIVKQKRRIKLKRKEAK